MCCCGKPTINGQAGYRWNNHYEPTSIYPVNPPALNKCDMLLYDEPGRCGGVDAHSHHYCLVKRYGHLHLLVRHGGGEEDMVLHYTRSFEDLISALDTHSRYWLFHTIYYAHCDGAKEAREQTTQQWRKAAAEKRIKTRKQRGSQSVKVWII